MKFLTIFSLFNIPTTIPNYRRNITKGYYYYHYAMHTIEIIKYHNLIATLISLGFKNKTREVNIEVFKRKYLDTLISIGDIKGKDSKVSLDCKKVVGYYKVEYYFTLDVDKVNNIILISFRVNSSSSLIKIKISDFY